LGVSKRKKVKVAMDPAMVKAAAKKAIAKKVSEP
tara:strand:+ start:210 stop:311 length:102 start_codon:yes stop_codon:yes gene_type:complete